MGRGDMLAWKSRVFVLRHRRARIGRYLHWNRRGGGSDRDGGLLEACTGSRIERLPNIRQIQSTDWALSPLESRKRRVRSRQWLARGMRTGRRGFGALELCGRRARV
jgi:hypothetical protein